MATTKYEQGGWYEGKQYWNGQLGPKGVVMNPGESGYGKKVSDEVAAQTNPNNVSYLKLPESKSAVTPFLNDYQTGFYNQAGSPEVRGVQSPEEIMSGLKGSGLLPQGQAPVAPSLVEQYGKLREQSGIGAIETSISELKAEQDAIASQLQVNKTAETGKPVAKNVIQGRISQQEQEAQDQYDFVSRKLARKQEEMNSALGNIQMIMQFTQTDYQNASQSYNTQFEQAISTINLVRGIQQDQKDDMQRAQDNARANAQIMVNMITKGNLSLDNLPPDQQAQLNKLEVQAGLPLGFFSAVKMDANANVLFTNTNNGITQVGIRNADGTVSVQSYGTKSSGSGSGAKPGSSEALAEATAQMAQKIGSRANSYGHIGPNDWQEALSRWLAAGFKREDFIKNFGQYADYNRGDFQSVYGFKNPNPRQEE